MEVEPATPTLQADNMPRHVKIAFDDVRLPVNSYLWNINYQTPGNDYRWAVKRTYKVKNPEPAPEDKELLKKYKPFIQKEVIVVISAVVAMEHADFVIVMGQETEQSKDISRRRKIYFQLEPDTPLPVDQGYLIVVGLDTHYRVALPHDFTPYQKQITKDYPLKEKDLVVICSKKENTAMQQKRMELVRKLASDPSITLDIYSRDMTAADLPEEARHCFKGPHMLVDKSSILSQYRYCLCIEKWSTDNYITSHFLDPVLSYSFPLYYGAPNVGQLYPEQSFHQLKNFPDDIDATVHEIRVRVSKPVTVEEVTALSAARRRILNHYTLWATLRQRLPEFLFPSEDTAASDP